MQKLRINPGRNCLYSKDLYESIALSGNLAEPYIKALCLNVVHDCNLRCKYCFAEEGEYQGMLEKQCL